MKKLRALWRLMLFAAYTICRVVQIVFANLLPGSTPKTALQIRRSWAGWLLPHIGIVAKVEGQAPDYPCIIMANHRSYLDPVVLMLDVLGYPVSKAEVANWPIIGYGARVSGVLFLKRENMSSRKKTLNGIAEKVREGFPVILFPEGTTHDRPQCVDLKRGGFQLAADQGFPIVPVMIEYGEIADYWIGNDTFLPHFFRRFGEKKIRVFVRYGPACKGSDAKDLLDQTRVWIDQQLQDVQPLLGRTD